MKKHYDQLVTESQNQSTLNIDECSTEEILNLINAEDHKVPYIVQKSIPEITKAVDLIHDKLKNGGCLIYVGAGTSGRLGVLDASECPPTYGTDPSLVQAYVAGGDVALRYSVEDKEDDINEGITLINNIPVTNKDVVLGIAASGMTPYVVGAIEEAKRMGASTITLSNNLNGKLNGLGDISIVVETGPEVITGSTRMKAGTSQKLILNMISTSVMIKLGKVYQNLMVDLKASNAKLYHRATRIVMRATGVSSNVAEKAIKEANGQVKLAILMLKTGLSLSTSEELLKSQNGHIKSAIGSIL